MSDNILRALSSHSVARMQDNIERQLEELEVLEAIYPDELTVNDGSVEAMKKVLLDNPEGINGNDDTEISKIPTLSFTIKLVLLASLEYSGQLKYIHPSITVEFPPEYPESSPPIVTKTVRLDSTELINAITTCLEEQSGEECAMQLVMSLNEQIETQNERTVQEHQKEVKKKEEQKAKSIPETAAALQDDPDEIPVIGRRIINSPYILKPAKIKDIKKCADELKLGGYAKVGKPGIIVIEGTEAACKQYCPMLENRGWKYQKVQGEQQEEGLVGGSIDDMRLIKGEFKVLGEDTMSEISQLCREAGLADLFFASLNIHNSVVGDGKGNNKGGSGKKGVDRHPKVRYIYIFIYLF